MPVLSENPAENPRRRRPDSARFLGSILGTTATHYFLATTQNPAPAPTRRLQRYPGDQRAILFGAVALAAQGDKKRSLRWLRRAEEIDPDDPVALYNMACAAAICSEVDLGLDFLERAIAVRTALRRRHRAPDSQRREAQRSFRLRSY